MTATYQVLPIAAVQENELNPRVDLGDLGELTSSIQTLGVIEPLVVRRALGSVGVYTLLAGHRRLAAARAAGLTEVPALVHTDTPDSPAARDLSVIVAENVHRRDLTVVEEAKAYQSLLDLGLTPTKVAKATGVKVARVKSRAAVSKLAEKAQAKLHTGEWSLEVAEALAEFADDPAALKRLEDTAGTHNWRWALDSARAQRDRQREIERLRKEAEKAGVPVFEGRLRSSWQPIADGEVVAFGLSELSDSDPAADEEPTSIAAEAHATCPGHAVALDGGSAVYLCTRGNELHRLWRNVWDEWEQAHEDADTGPDATRSADRQQTPKDERHETAQRLRREHLTEILTGRAGGKEALGVMLRWIAQQLLAELSSGWQPRGRVALFGAFIGQPDPGDDIDDQEYVDSLAAHLATAKTEELIRGCAAAQVASVDAHITNVHAYRVHDVRSIYDLLEATGYVLSDTERDLLGLNDDQDDEDGSDD